MSLKNWFENKKKILFPSLLSGFGLLA